MTYDIDAIYDNGVFRPLEPVTIPDGLRVHLHVEGETASDATEAKARRQAALEEFLLLRLNCRSKAPPMVSLVLTMIEFFIASRDLR